MVIFLTDADKKELQGLIEQVRAEIPESAEVTDEQIAAAVEAYFAEHPVVGGEGLTTAQITALDELFKIAAYKADASAKYAAFRQAFGLDEPSEPDEPDVPVEPDEPDVPSGEWETVRVLTTDDIKYGVHLTNQAQLTRATYNALDIPAEKGYTYKVESEVTSSNLYSVIALYDVDGGEPTTGNWGNNCQTTYIWKTATEPWEVDVVATNLDIKDVSKNLCLMVGYKVDSGSVVEGSITKVTISRKAVS